MSQFRNLPIKRRFLLSFYFEPRDLWIGIYWNKEKRIPYDLDVYICIVPCLPIRLTWTIF